MAFGAGTLPAGAAQVTATWQGPVNGNYATASSWSVGEIPLNNATDTYIVQILGTGRSVILNTPGSHTIDEFLLDGGSTFAVVSSSLIQPTSLTVLGRALIGGRITTDRASFTALGTGTDFVGSTATLSAVNGGVIRIGAASYSARGITGGTLLNADGAGSQIDLASVRTFDVGSPVNGTYTNSVLASNGGAINLAGVRAITAPAHAADTLGFSAAGGGRIDLSGVQTISGPTVGTGNTRFSADGGSFVLGPLQSANRVFVDLRNGSTMSLGGFAGTAMISDSTIAVSGGSRLNAAPLQGEFSVRGFTGGTILSAVGVGTVLDLSGLTLLDSGSPVNGTYSNVVSATDRAAVNLRGVRTLIAPAHAADTLQFTVNGGASLDLSGLQSLSGVTLNTGNTRFTVDNGSVVLGPLQSANRLFVDLGNGATLRMGGFAGQATVSESTFQASGGSRLDASALAGDLSVRSFTGVTFLAAAGPGSLLDLSGLRSIDSGSPVNGTYSNTASASDTALLNLSRVTTLVAPAHAADTLSFVATSGGRIDLSALQTLAGLTINTGNTRFTADNASIVLGPLQSANRLFVELANGASLQVGGYGGSATVSNSAFGVSSGATLSGAALRGEYTARAFQGGTLMSATGAGSVLNLSGLHTIDSAAPVNGTWSNTISAADRGRIDLSGVRSLIAPEHVADSLLFSASGRGLIDLSSLQSITSAGGLVRLSASTGGTIVLNGLSTGRLMRMNLVDAGSGLVVNGSLALQSGSTLAAGAGTRIDVRGSFTFDQTVESELNLDLASLVFSGGSGAHSLEVGGRRLTMPAAGAVVTGNFAIGQLTLGDTGAEWLSLVDAVDNGNRSSPEVLYLNGLGGANGLRLLAGSTLVLGEGIDLYTTEAGNWVHINDLFVNGVTTIAYDQGFITTTPVPEPGSLALLLAGLGVVVLRRRQMDR